MIGYYNKSQWSPKPIYKKNRIILNQPIGKRAGEVDDESYQSFINANEVSGIGKNRQTAIIKLTNNYYRNYKSINFAKSRNCSKLIFFRWNNFLIER